MGAYGGGYNYLKMVSAFCVAARDDDKSSFSRSLNPRDLSLFLYIVVSPHIFSHRRRLKKRFGLTSAMVMWRVLAAAVVVGLAGLAVVVV